MVLIKRRKWGGGHEVPNWREVAPVRSEAAVVTVMSGHQLPLRSSASLLQMFWLDTNELTGACL